MFMLDLEVMGNFLFIFSDLIIITMAPVLQWDCDDHAPEGAPTSTHVIIQQGLNKLSAYCEWVNLVPAYVVARSKLSQFGVLQYLYLWISNQVLTPSIKLQHYTAPGKVHWVKELFIHEVSNCQQSYNSQLTLIDATIPPCMYLHFVHYFPACSSRSPEHTFLVAARSLMLGVYGVTWWGAWVHPTICYFRAQPGGWSLGISPRCADQYE